MGPLGNLMGSSLELVEPRGVVMSRPTRMTIQFHAMFDKRNSKSASGLVVQS